MTKSNKPKDCFCAFCKKPRKYNSQKTVSLLQMFFCLLLGLGTGYLIKQEVDFRFALFSGIYLVIAEIFILVRWRMHLRCPHCGFDPALYLKSNELAAEQVKAFLEKRMHSADFILKDPLDLPKLPKQKAQQIKDLIIESKNIKADKSGSLLSKQV